MSDTTDINTLPGGTGGNVTLETKEMPPQRRPPQGAPAALPPKRIPPPNMANKIISGIKTAAGLGATQLPSRDVPRMPQQYSQDPRIKPNYVPPVEPEKSDYIGDHDSMQSMIDKNKKKELQNERLESIYDEVQIPIFVMILYLIFQLPIFQRFLKAHLPALFGGDGNPKLAGYLFKTIMFGITFYIIQKGAHYLSHMR
jgi:hypothetical protein